jgi:hypothetical protein
MKGTAPFKIQETFGLTQEKSFPSGIVLRLAGTEECFWHWWKFKAAVWGIIVAC